MIHGAHVIIYSKDADADRAFFRDVLKYKSVDAGHGWLIFALPPAEVAVHPSEENDVHELFLMCDDVHALIAEMKKKKVKCSPVDEQALGIDHAAYAARRREARRLPAEARFAAQDQRDVIQFSQASVCPWRRRTTCAAFSDATNSTHSYPRARKSTPSNSGSPGRSKMTLPSFRRRGIIRISAPYTLRIEG
jgi:catechol 2,3-dioxygenase-like lactoylglutathione lyase family enzyme